MIFLYQLFFPLLVIGVLAHLVWSGRGRAMREGLSDIKERLGLLSERAPGAVWFHAASVGEVRAIEPLVRRLRAQPKCPRLLITTSTIAGRERARALFGKDCASLAPVDFYPAVRSFLKRTQPSALILVETELWPMMIRLARASGVRLGIVNGRITERAFPRYRLIRRCFTPLLASFERVAAQTPVDAERFEALGVLKQALAVCGNMKHDVPPPGKDALSEARAWVSALSWDAKPVWIAGSTRQGEEEILLEAHARASQKIPELRLILAPRHPERSAEVAALLNERRVRFIRLSELPSPTPEGPPSCLLVDRLGALGALYGTATAAFVGGTMVPVGGHDVLEPARLSVPVLFGPHTESTPETAEALLSSGGAALVRDAESLAAALLAWMGDAQSAQSAGEKALRTAQRFAGAAERTSEHLRPLLLQR